MLGRRARTICCGCSDRRRHGIVYYGGRSWTGKHDAWLRHDALPQLSTRATRRTLDSDDETVLGVKARWDRLDTAIGEIGDWHHRARYTVGKTMRERWDLAPVAARARGDEGNRRLHERWVTFIDRRKKYTIANVAIARELAGWSWSLAVMEDEETLICFAAPAGRWQRGERPAQHL